MLPCRARPRLSQIVGNGQFFVCHPIIPMGLAVRIAEKIGKRNRFLALLFNHDEAERRWCFCF